MNYNIQCAAIAWISTPPKNWYINTFDSFICGSALQFSNNIASGFSVKERITLRVTSLFVNIGLIFLSRHRNASWYPKHLNHIINFVSGYCLISLSVNLIYAIATEQLVNIGIKTIAISGTLAATALLIHTAITPIFKYYYGPDPCHSADMLRKTLPLITVSALGRPWGYSLHHMIILGPLCSTWISLNKYPPPPAPSLDSQRCYAFIPNSGWLPN